MNKEIEILYLVDTGFACAGVVVNQYDIIVETAPIFHWARGKPIETLRKWKKVKSITKAK
jgi:hypothetical protein